jgi:hypothetical protein
MMKSEFVSALCASDVNVFGQVEQAPRFRCHLPGWCCTAHHERGEYSAVEVYLDINNLPFS